MKLYSSISKSITFLLLTSIVYMHLCSVLCATGIDICCGKDDDDCQKTSCEHTTDNGNKDHDCQDLHFSFFSTTGQFAFEKNTDSIKAFQCLIAVFTPLFTILQTEQSKNVFAYNGFHPPPPKADLRILFQSFLI